MVRTLTQYDKNELAWAAGFWDGEGHTSGRFRQDKGRTIHAMVDQIHKETLERFQRAVGFGSVLGPYKFSNPRWSDRYRWETSNFKDCRRLFALLEPFLCEPKRRQFENAIKTYLGDFNGQNLDKIRRPAKDVPDAGGDSERSGDTAA